jgi:hypothetical protein
LRRVRIDDVRKIIHQAHGRRYLNRLQKEQPGGMQRGDESRHRQKSHEQCVQNAFSLDFMVRDNVYLADDPSKT